MKLTEKILSNLNKTPRDNNYKTTSFTLLREDYAQFKEICEKLGFCPSQILRELVRQMIRENTQ